MRLDENFTVENDTNCWTLYYEKEKKNDKGELYTSRSQTYHGSMKQALITYCDNALKPCKSVTEVLEAIHSLEKTINDY